MDIKHRCRLDASQKCFVLTIESEKPIFCIGVCCDVEIELMSPINSVAILSLSPPDEVHGYPVLATFRCQESANRLDVRFRAHEGRPGCMTCFVLPKISAKLAVSLRHPILPLCLHECAPEASLEKGSLMKIHGGFSDEELCLWLAAALPDFPKRWQSDGLLFFRDTQSNQIMSFRKLDNGGAAEIECQDICALNILRETLLHEASKRNYTLNVELKIDVEGVSQSLERLWSEIETFRNIDARASLGKALAEIQQQVARPPPAPKRRMLLVQDENGMPLLDEDMEDMLKSVGESEELLQKREMQMDRSAVSICHLLDHYSKLTGTNKPQTKLTGLKTRLRTGDATFQELLDVL